MPRYAGILKPLRVLCAGQDLGPSTPEICNFSRRFSFTARSGMFKNPIVMIQCEGVICDFVYTSFWGTGKEEFYMTSGLFKGLLELKDKFQLVLVSRLSREKLANVVGKLKAKGVTFDAVYKYYKSKILHSYSQAIKDFHIHSPLELQQRCIV